MLSRRGRRKCRNARCRTPLQPALFHGQGLFLEICLPYKVKKGKERQGTLNTIGFRFSDRGVRICIRKTKNEIKL